jgi:hypothetical protein
MEMPFLPGIELPPVPALTPQQQAKRERDRILKAADEKAGEAFRNAARAFIVAYLESYGPTAGEVLVNECRAAGIVPNNGMDSRAFGGVFLRLSMRKQICVCGQVQRTKGHHTGGGNVWGLVK